MKSHMKKTIVALSMATLAAGSTHAAITAFEAESGTLGSDYDTFTDATALGGSYIEHASDNFTPSTDRPHTDAFIVSYDLNLAAGDYDVYVKMRYVNNGEDSFFIATDFGDLDPTVADNWLQINTANNGLGGTQTTFAWSNALPDGSPLTFTAPGGSVTWEIGGREEGLDIDAFAFVSSGDTVTATDLDNAVLGVIPEPSSAALLGLAGLAMILRRRR